MQLKIITYNIWDLPLWFVKDRRNRINAVAQFLAQSEADIICVQESWNQRSRARFSKILSDAGYHVAVASEKMMVLGNSGLITFSKFPIVSNQFVSFPRMASTFIELFTGRGVLETVVDTPQGLLPIFNTHLHMPSNFFDRTIRFKQIKKLFEFVNTRGQGPAVLAGDFNEDRIWENKDVWDFFKNAGFGFPCVESMHNHTPTYRVENPLVDQWINRTGISRRFDYIFLRGMQTLGFAEKSCRSLYLSPVLSDHDPVEVILTLK